MPATTTKPKTKAGLALVSGAPPQKLTLLTILHLLYLALPRIFLTLPLSTLWKYTLGRYRKKGVVQAVGRPFYAEFVSQLTQYLFGRSTVAQTRVLFNRTYAYSLAYAGLPFRGYRDWVEYVDVNGVTGRWIAPPGTKRSEDEVVLYYIHGGGFVMDTAGNAQNFMIALAKEMNINRDVQFSIFSLDYELAPEFKYPSQLIETLAGYHYLVNTLKISEDKICLSGDSAGGNLATAFLLHLARPHPRIIVPKEFGPTPKRPGSALLISPFVKLVSDLASRADCEPYDLIDTNGAFMAALDYIGSKRVDRKTFVPSWNPLHLLYFPNEGPPKGFTPPPTTSFDVNKEGNGLDLLNSPYVNPSVCHDLQWWKEACPPAGRTMLVWGGKEILRDDVLELKSILDQAGVAPTPLVKPYGVHDWLLYDHFIPGMSSDNSLGPDGELRYGIDKVGAFLQDTDLRVRASHWEEYSVKKHGPKSSRKATEGSDRSDAPSKVADPTSEGAVEEKGETGGAEVEKVGDSVVIVSEHSGGKEEHPKKKLGKGKK